MNNLFNSETEIYGLLFILWACLIIHSLYFGIQVSLRPPEQIYNPIAVIKGILMTALYYLPSQGLIYNYGLGMAMLNGAFVVAFTTSLGIVGSIWYVKHTAEHDAHFSITKLNEAN